MGPLEGVEELDCVKWMALHDEDDEVTAQEKWNEFSLFGHNRLRAERIKRSEELEAEILRQRGRFILEGQKRHDEIMDHFMAELRSQNVEDMRKNAVPAYVFEKFPKLSVELQLKIWTMACPLEEPKQHVILPDDFTLQSYIRRKQSSNSSLEHSSWILNPSGQGMSDKAYLPPPILLKVCRTSRAVVLKSYTAMACKKRTYKNERDILWPHGKKLFNTACDSFYLGGAPWWEFKMLADIVIKSNTTRPIFKEVQEELDSLLQIQYLTVDYEILGTAPQRVWTEFKKLKKLTAVLVKEFEDDEWWISSDGELEDVEARNRISKEEEKMWLGNLKESRAAEVEFLKELKAKWLPSRRVTAGEHFESGMKIGGYYTDSEHETEGPYVPRSCDCKTHPLYPMDYVGSTESEDEEGDEEVELSDSDFEIE